MGRSELAAADSSAWKIVYGHYPMHSGGHYGGSDTLRASVEPILEQNKVDGEPLPRVQNLLARKGRLAHNDGFQQ